MIKNKREISLYDLERIWYDCYGESFNREYPGAFDKLAKMVSQRTNIQEDKTLEKRQQSNSRCIDGSCYRKRKAG